jgi:glycosyltransferase involved in cell wall biosynthesis
MNYEIFDSLNIYRVNKLSAIPAKIRKICKETDIDLIHSHNPRFAIMSLLAFTGKPLILEIHTIRKVNPLKELLIRLTYKLCNKIIVLSESMKKEINRNYGVSPLKIEVIHNGVDLNEFSQTAKNDWFRNRFNISEKYIIGYIGTFHKWQGVEYLARSFINILLKRNDVRLLIVGEGPEFNTIKNIISDSKMDDKVTLTGKVNPDDVPNYLNAMDVFVIPRPSTPETETAVPLKILEAMSAGLPIVATRVGGLTEIIEDRINGILADPGNPKQLAEKIMFLLDNDLLRYNISLKNKKKAENYNWETSSKILLNLYNELL